MKYFKIYLCLFCFSLYIFPASENKYLEHAPLNSTVLSANTAKNKYIFFVKCHL